MQFGSHGFQKGPGVTYLTPVAHGAATSPLQHLPSFFVKGTIDPQERAFHVVGNLNSAVSSGLVNGLGRRDLRIDPVLQGEGADSTLLTVDKPTKMLPTGQLWSRV